MVDVQQDRDAQFLIDVYEVLHDLLGCHRVERGDRLVRENDMRVLRQRARQRDALLLSAGELIRTHIGLVQNANLVQRLERLEFVLFAERAQQHAPERHVRHAGGEHVFDHACARDEIKRLEHHADPAPELPQALAGQARDIGAVYCQRAGCDLMHAVDGTQQRGLARAGTANDGDEFTVIDAQADVVQADRAVGIYFGYMVKYDHKASSFL